MAQNVVKHAYELLVVGGSAGSLEVILRFLPSIEESKAFAIVLVLHRKNVDSVLTDLLADKTKWKVKEVEEKEPILPGYIYIAPPDYHLLIEKDRTFSLDYSEKLHYSRPSIDVTFETAAEAYGSALACLLLSGANADGAEGLKIAKEAGALVMVQSPGEATVSYMPQQALEKTSVDRILRTDEMAGMINRLNG